MSLRPTSIIDTKLLLHKRAIFLIATIDMRFGLLLDVVQLLASGPGSIDPRGQPKWAPTRYLVSGQQVQPPSVFASECRQLFILRGRNGDRVAAQTV